MEKIKITATVKQIVKNLVVKNYATIASADYLQEMSAEQIQLLIEEYGEELTMPPDSAFNNIEIYEMSEAEVSLDCDLWCNNERSDLTLICNLREINGKIEYTIEDIHIL